MSGFETNLKSTRPRPGHHEPRPRPPAKGRDRDRDRDLKIGLETSITGTNDSMSLIVQ